jgi:hypothetical protein
LRNLLHSTQVFPEQTDKEIMLGLVSPRDIHDAVTAARKIEGLDARITGLSNRAGSMPDPVERLLASPDAHLLRPETSLLSVMDRISEADEERRTGRKKESAFDQIISAKVAAALGPVYSGPNGLELEITADDPFSTATAFSRLKPRMDPKALAIARENGFPLDEILDSNSSTASMNNLENPVLMAASHALAKRSALAGIARGRLY